MKKEYIIPVANVEVTDLKKVFLDGASGEGMGYGGDASEEEITEADAKYHLETPANESNLDKGLW